MRLLHPNPGVPKGWYAGPWESDLTISVGYANEGINEPHRHTRITEFYMVARGTSTIRVEEENITLREGDTLIIEPGEGHTFLSSSADYFHFVVHVPGLAGEEARTEKEWVTLSQLGLANVVEEDK